MLMVVVLLVATAVPYSSPGLLQDKKNVANVTADVETAKNECSSFPKATLEQCILSSKFAFE